MIHHPELMQGIETKAYSSARTLGAFSLGRHKAGMVSNVRPGEFAFFYAPGWHTNGETIAKNFDRHVAHLGSTHYGVHPAGRFSIDAQKEAWLDARKKDGFRPAKIYAQSKGVLTVSHTFADESFRKDFGEVDSLCFDSGVSSRKDIKRVPFMAMLLGMGVPLGEAGERVNREVLRRSLSRNVDFDPAAVTPEEAHENSAASALTSLEACKTQLQYLWSHDIADLDLQEFGRSVPNKKYMSSAGDGLVNLARAAMVINRSYGGGFVHWIDTTRRPGDHATGTERPQGVIDALTDQNAGNYRVVTIGDRQPVAGGR